MIEFETFKDVDQASGVETWRAYFGKQCGHSDYYDCIMPSQGASVGYGDTELEAIGNLCLDEIVRIEEAEQRRLNGAGLILKNQTVEEMLFCCLEDALESLVYADSKLEYNERNNIKDEADIKWRERTEKRYFRFDAGLKRRGL